MHKQSIQLSVILENKCPDNTLYVEHGISFHLESSGKQILFDTGQSDKILKNAQTLGIDLKKTDAVILSHGHDDHTGGLKALLQLSPSAKIYAHPDAFIERYSIKNIKQPKSIGISNENLKSAMDVGFTPVLESMSIFDPVHVTGPIPRANDYEDTGGPFYLDSNAKTPDLILDDQSIFFESLDGLVIIMGCAHSGIINTIRYCQQLSKTNKIHAIIGGFHLLNASNDRMQKTLEALKEINPTILAPAHCTGEKQTLELKKHFPHSFRTCHCGSQFTFKLKSTTG